MKLRTKLSLYSTLSKLIVLVAFLIIVPMIVSIVSTHHTDSRLQNMKEKVIKLVDKVGIKNFLQEEQDSVFADYNILKEEYIVIEATEKVIPATQFENTERIIEGETVEYRVLNVTFIHAGHLYLLEIGKSLEVVKELNGVLQKVAFFVLIISFAITILLNIGYSNYLLKPFHMMIERKLKNVYHPEKFNFETIPTTTTDFIYLDQTINEMMHKIKDVFGREKEFISNVSHELLTPISVLQTRFENMLTENKLDEESSLKIIESLKTLNRLKKITNTLLLISRIENEQYLKNDTLGFESLAAEVVSEIEERFTEKNIQATVDFKEDYVMQHCNHDLLFTLLFNLVNNAIKYNKQDGKIFIRGYYSGNNYVVEVEDTGIGIPAEQRSTIFSRFKRLNSNGTEGYGLGLPIVQTIAEFHDIQVFVNSEPGQGSVFKLIIPVPLLEIN
ncbi:MAG: sensor histidine kinase [Bacteroidia bacterium]